MTWGLHTKLYNASKVQDNWLVKSENGEKSNWSAKRFCVFPVHLHYATSRPRHWGLSKMTAGQTLQDAEKHHNRNQASTFSFSPFTFMAHCEIPRTATESSNKRKMFPNLLWLQQCKLLSILNTHTAIQIKLLTSCPQNEGGFWTEREGKHSKIGSFCPLFLFFNSEAYSPKHQNWVL